MTQPCDNTSSVSEEGNASENMGQFRQSPVYCPKCKRHLAEGEWVLQDSRALFCSPICKNCGSYCAVYQEIEMI